MSIDKIHDLSTWIESIIQDFLNDPFENLLWPDGPEKAWADALVGYSRGDDPVFASFKEHVGPFHWTPGDAFRLAYPETPVEDRDLTIISWVLPKTEPTKTDNRRETTYPSQRWARARIFGEEINDRLKQRVVDDLLSEGFAALAPTLLPAWSWQTSEQYGFASTWSERHVAYASGLGTFGLCDGLITAKGKAMRAGSVIARIDVPATPRPYTNHRQYCLFYTSRACRACISRCPVDAISENGHDKMKCFNHLATTIAPYVKERFGFEGYGCGLCQTGVPCESGIPVVSAHKYTQPLFLPEEPPREKT
ncbi:MAG: epoxyqueuosine reductase [Desulfomonilia bacterium]|nr:epoxyqueuosine reductase [Desulfomonilia bacterium]